MRYSTSSCLKSLNFFLFSSLISSHDLAFLLDYPCASTTRYNITTQGACGCGKNSTILPWVYQIYTAGASLQIFGNSTWCGMGCGQCFNVTPTGFSAQGKGTTNIVTITILVTNLCSSQLCVGPLNNYGYGAHFNLMDNNMAGKITDLGWDNPEVYFTMVDCPSSYSLNFKDCNCIGQISPYDGPGTPSISYSMHPKGNFLFLWKIIFFFFLEIFL